MRVGTPREVRNREFRVAITSAGVRELVAAGHADWDAALALAGTLPGVDPAKLAIWGFSAAGGHIVRVAARHPELAAAMAQSPTTDGQAAARNALRYQTPQAILRFTWRGVLDALGGLAGREPLLVPLSGPRARWPSSPPPISPTETARSTPRAGTRPGSGRSPPAPR